ncbi:uncharacterized protein [Oscarella lobularis]|uniref:uncharacterized protein n=1 Tax=Oscarella lobularis TaxID=121494 RepID=UPI0033142471
MSNHLRFLRFSTLFGLVFVLDAITVASLWVAGGPSWRAASSASLEASISHYTFYYSPFDLVLLSLLKLILSLLLLSRAESASLRALESPYEPTYRRSNRIFVVLLSILNLTVFGFGVVKGGVVLGVGVEHAFGATQPLTYGIAIATSVAFSFVEVVLCLMAAKRTTSAALRANMRSINVDDDDVDGTDDEKKKKRRKVDLKRLFGLVAPEAYLVLTAFVFLLISTGASSVAPLFFAKVIDAANSPSKGMADVNKWTLRLILILFAGSIAAMFRSFLFQLTGETVVATLRKKLFNSVVSQEVAFFDNSRTGDLTNRLSSDTQVIQNAVTNNISMLLRYSLQVLVSLGLMFYLSWSLTLVLLSVVPVVSIGAVVYGNYIKRLRKKFQDKLGEAGTIAEESISSIRTVRSFSNEEKSMDEYGVKIDESFALGKKMAMTIGAFSGLIFTLIQGATVVVLWYGAKLLHENISGSRSNSMTPGELTGFMLYMINIAMAFAFLSNLYGEFMQAVGASIRVFELLDRRPEIPIKGGNQLVKFEGSIQFDDVSFRYPSRPDTDVLKGVSFRVEPGTVVALVGPSGGGKSTIVSLIERFYEPGSGTIQLGDADVSALDPLWFRRRVAMVGQEPVLFGCSIAENISYGKKSTQEEIEDVAKQANAHEFIMSFENGYKTIVGERGIRLSGGQKQRVAIARALLMNPIVLLLDEATSALDAESEHLVQEAIDRAVVGRSVLVIAHRLSTVRNASKVLVVDKGVIVETGTHDELIERDGVYKKLVLRQLNAS